MDSAHLQDFIALNEGVIARVSAGDRDGACELIRESCRRGVLSGIRGDAEVAAALIGLGHIARLCGRTRLARLLYLSVVAGGMAVAPGESGLCWQLLAEMDADLNPDRARRRAKFAVQLFGACGDERLATARTLRGEMQMQTGRTRGAIWSFEAARDACERFELADPDLLCRITGGLGDAYDAAGEPEQACTAWTRLLGLSREPVYRAVVMGHLARAEGAAGRPDAARAHYVAALELIADPPAPGKAVDDARRQIVMGYVDLLIDLGLAAKALSIFREHWGDVCVAANDPGRTQYLVLLSWLEAATDDTEAAKGHLTQVAEIEASGTPRSGRKKRLGVASQMAADLGDVPLAVRLRGLGATV